MARGTRGEQEWVKTLEDDGAVIKTDIKKEVETLNIYVDWLMKHYSNKRPIDLNERELVRHGKNLFKIFSKIRSSIFVLLRRDLSAESRLSYLFGREAVDFQSNTLAINRIRKEQENIEKELKELVDYWEYVKDKWELPKRGFFRKGLAKFNERSIVAPLEYLKERDIKLFGEIDHTLKIAFKKVKRRR